jgi:hypothetical protein
VQSTQDDLGNVSTNDDGIKKDGKPFFGRPLFPFFSPDFSLSVFPCGLDSRGGRAGRHEVTVRFPGIAAADWEEFLFSGDTLDRCDYSRSRRAGQCPLANIKGQLPPELVRRVDELAVAFVANLVADGLAGREEVAVVARRRAVCFLGTPEPFVATDALLGNSSADRVWSIDEAGVQGRGNNPSAWGERSTGQAQCAQTREP